MSAHVDPARPQARHAAYAFFLAATVPPFVGAALSDYAYRTSAQMQWSNFAAWLLAGGLVFGGGALACGLAGLARRHRATRVALSFVILLAAWVLGFIDALVHARDAWAVMPTGFVLSVVVAVLACIAAWLGFAAARAGDAP